ncbi:MAG TPA: glycosyltransferase [Candidatus Angelobacter sp.]|nr:glycosyltransferase [Candidatus Angelobacter sp.]
MFAIFCGIFSVLAWLYLLLARGGFWQVGRHLPPAKLTGQSSCRVAVIVPARNEAEVIGQGISSILHQTGSHSIHIFLIDDASTDGTAEIAGQAAAESGRSSTLTIIQGRPLPSGWTGKLWAVHQGIERAREFAPQFFLLTDADILHAPDNIATLVAVAEQGAYDLASFMVKLHCDTLAERFLVPAFVFFFFKLYPPSWIDDPRRKTAGAAGGSILVRPEALERAGGIEAIRNEIIDDCALARAVKDQGGKLWLGLTGATASLRPYRTFREVGSMISRSAFNQLHHSVLMLLAALIGLTMIYLLPPLLVFAHRPLPVALGASAWLLMTLAYLPMVRFYRLNPLWGLALPLTAIFYMGATLHSAFRFWSGRGGEWKGRTQDREGES